MFFYQLTILSGSLIILVVFKKTKYYTSLNGLVLLSVFLILFLIRLKALAELETFLFKPESFYYSGVIILIFTLIVLFIFSLLRDKNSSHYKDIAYSLRLLPIYILFGFIQQLFLQFILLESLYSLLNNVVVSVSFSSLLFGLFHYGKRFIIFPLATAIVCFVWSLVYLRWGNILWPAFSHAIIGSIYYSWFYKGNVVKNKIKLNLR